MPTRERPTLYVADLKGCAGLSTLTADALSAAFAGALTRAGATVVDALIHDFSGAAVTCVLILAESHAVLHTWPETGAVNIDIFSCTAKLRSRAAIDELSRALGAIDVSIQETARARG